MAKKLTTFPAGQGPEKKGKQKPKSEREEKPTKEATASVSKMSGPIQSVLFKGEIVPEISLKGATLNADVETWKDLGKSIKDQRTELTALCRSNGLKPGQEYVDPDVRVRVKMPPLPDAPPVKTERLSDDEVSFYADRRARQDKKLGDDTMPRPKREKPAAAPLDASTEPTAEATH